MTNKNKVVVFADDNGSSYTGEFTEKDGKVFFDVVKDFEDVHSKKCFDEVKFRCVSVFPDAVPIFDDIHKWEHVGNEMIGYRFGNKLLRLRTDDVLLGTMIINPKTGFKSGIINFIDH